MQGVIIQFAISVVQTASSQGALLVKAHFAVVIAVGCQHAHVDDHKDEGQAFEPPALNCGTARTWSSTQSKAILAHEIKRVRTLTQRCNGSSGQRCQLPAARGVPQQRDLLAPSLALRCVCCEP
jgi:hypothetical protein